LNDFIDIKKSESNSKKSKSKSRSSLNMDQKSEEISLSQLNLIANKKKLQPKKSTEISISKLKKENNSSTQKTPPNVSVSESVSQKSMTETRSALKEERYTRKVNRENKDSRLYQLKLNLLNKLDLLYAKNHWKYYKKLSPNNLLSEIEIEHETKKREAGLKGFVTQMRMGLYILIVAVENGYGYLDDDIKGWSEAIYINIQAGEFDNDLLEISEKYFGGGSEWPVEVRLLFSIIVSGGSFIVTKKFIGTQMGGNGNQGASFMTNILGSFMNADGNGLGNLVNSMLPDTIKNHVKTQAQQNTQVPPTQAQERQENINQFQPAYGEEQGPAPFRNYSQQQTGQRFSPDSSEDALPSKFDNENFRDPEFDETEIKNVLEQMKRTKLKEPKIETEQSESSIEDLIEKKTIAAKNGKKPAAKKRVYKKKNTVQA
jgi:hypothetical protein